MNGKVDTLLKDFKGRKLNGPNDLWVDKNGSVYLPTHITNVTIGHTKSLT